MATKRTKDTGPMPLDTARLRMRGVANQLFGARASQQGGGFPAVEFAEAMEALIDAARADERAKHVPPGNDGR